MGLFPEAQAAQLAGREPNSVWLFEFDFATQPMRVWLNYGELISGGYSWQGLGRMAGVSGIEQVINAQAPEMTLTLSGVDPNLTVLMRDEWESEARDRALRTYMAFVDDQGQALDDPYLISTVVMKRALFKLGEDRTRTIGLTCESGYALRARTPGAMYTDRDQQRRFPGDMGFSFVPKLRNKTTIWPDY